MDNIDTVLDYGNPLPKVKIFEDYFLKNLKLIISQKYDLDDVLDKMCETKDYEGKISFYYNFNNLVMA